MELIAESQAGVSAGRRFSAAALARHAPVILAPALVLAALIIAWQFAFHTSQLPPPSDIVSAMRANGDTIWTGVRVTFWEEAILGCGSGFLVGVVCARFGWLRRGLVPYAVASSAIPIIGMAPVLIFWFGLEWPAKAAVVAVMTFFPMLVNTVAGLTAYDPLSRELLSSYGAGEWTVFRKLRLPASMPMVFNGLKICSVLSLIGAVIAEYFPGPIDGLGFQLQNEASNQTWDVVWAYTVVTCLIGIAFYCVLLVLERIVTFWHVSYRAR
jgi:NitT/TauT family transport system permease protein